MPPVDAGEKMKKKEYAYGVCGVFCEMCPTGNGQISKLASDLLYLTNDSYEWAEKYVDFKFDDVRKGLKWFEKSKCPTCLRIKEPWCDVLKCEKARKLKSCLLCSDFLVCPSTKYQRERYPFVVRNHRRVKKVGLRRHFEEERKRARKGVSLIDIRKY